LKARFRRRELPTPSTYLRWFRLLAVANHLADPEVTVAVAARRHGYTSDGNLCRALKNVAEMTPTELRTASGRQRLLVDFTRACLMPDHLEGWASFDELFRRRAA
jgi:AraC-like DNA-binding protein